MALTHSKGTPSPLFVVPAKAGIQGRTASVSALFWIPACERVKNPQWRGRPPAFSASAEKPGITSKRPGMVRNCAGFAGMAGEDARPAHQFLHSPLID
jgi:hypothetical protein